MIPNFSNFIKKLPWYVTLRKIQNCSKWIINSPTFKLRNPFVYCLVPSAVKIYSEISTYDVEENLAHLMTMARIALEKGDIDKAEAILLMGIQISEEYKTYGVLPYMYDILASISFATGNLKKAEELLVNIIEKLVHLGVPENDNQIIDFKLRLSRIYSAYNDVELAEIGYKDCLNTQINKIENGDTTTRTGILYINCMFWYGLHKLKTSDFKEARFLIHSAYDYSIKIKGLSPYQEMVILYTLADLNLELEEYDLALQSIQSAILMGKGIGSLDLARCYYKLAKIYTKMNAWDCAKKTADESLKLATLFSDVGTENDVTLLLESIEEHLEPK